MRSSSPRRERGAERIGVEDPAWPRIPGSIAQVGLEPVPVRVDAEGLVLDELERMSVDAVVVSPAHQYPTGVVMSACRRSGLIAWARERGALIVEDDYDAEYRYDREPVASLQGMAPDCVAYVATPSKTLAPGLRVGWIVVPSHLVAEVATQHGVGASAGLHLVAWLPDGADERAIADRAAARGVAVHTLHGECALTAPARPALLLGYGSIVEPVIPRAVEELARTARL